ncbi:MAG TPA: hypothetical protein VF528_00735 [Pyrinomonadaceae bacterium]|jgi:hypothetical protein
MKSSFKLVSLSLILLALTALQACSGKANNQQASASKFIGTWKVAPESETDFKGGPITIKADYTYSAQKTADPSSPNITGPFTVSRDEKLFLGGELEKFGREGMRIGDDGRMMLPKDGRTIYFVKL